MPTFSRDIDVGRGGLAGHYTQMMNRLRGVIPAVMIAAAAWTFLPIFLAWFDFKIAPFISLSSFAWLGLAGWMAYVLYRLSIALWYGAAWLRLEVGGIEFILMNDHLLRVTYYRQSDGSLQYDETTRKERLDQELECVHRRRKEIMVNFGWFVLFCAVRILTPLAFAYFFEITGEGMRDFMNGWAVPAIVQDALLFFAILPRLCLMLLTLFEGFVYSTGAQYIPGAKLIDPVVDEKTLEMMRGEQVHGSATFATATDAAFRMRKPRA